MRDDSAAPQALGSVWLAHQGGLHARPAIKLTKLAKRFAASIAIGRSVDGPWIDAKSVAKVMAMKTPSGVTVFFTAQGNDARAAVDALTALVTADFADDEPA